MLRTEGLEVEAQLVFAALHRLLRPLPRPRTERTAPQARALRVAFGEDDGTFGRAVLVDVATLSMLTNAAEENLVLCVVDDAHWLDSATAEALLFGARRLGADRVVMLFTARDGAGRLFDPQDLSELVLTRTRRGRVPHPPRSERLGDGNAPKEVAERLIAETRRQPAGAAGATRRADATNSSEASSR